MCMINDDKSYIGETILLTEGQAKTSRDCKECQDVGLEMNMMRKTMKVHDR